MHVWHYVFEYFLTSFDYEKSTIRLLSKNYSLYSINTQWDYKNKFCQYFIIVLIFLQGSACLMLIIRKKEKDLLF